MNNSQVVEFENIKIIWIDLSLKKYFHKSIYILLFNKYFYRNKKLNLCFGDRVTVQNDFPYEYGGSKTGCKEFYMCL